MKGILDFSVVRETNAMFFAQHSRRGVSVGTGRSSEQSAVAVLEMLSRFRDAFVAGDKCACQSCFIQNNWLMFAEPKQENANYERAR